METKLTTLCYMERGGEYLMLHRTKKENDENRDKYMHLFTADAWTGEQRPCDEGELAWIGKDELLTKKLWAGDRIFPHLLAEDAPFFSLKLVYRGEELTAAELDGKPLALG